MTTTELQGTNLVDTTTGQLLGKIRENGTFGGFTAYDASAYNPATGSYLLCGSLNFTIGEATRKILGRLAAL